MLPGEVSGSWLCWYISSPLDPSQSTDFASEIPTQALGCSSALKFDVHPSLPCRQWQSETFICQFIPRLADTSRLTYPHEADVFSCWSHSILITWECTMVRFIYFFFKCYLLEYLHEIHVSFLRTAPGGQQLRASWVAWSCQDLPSVIWWWPFSRTL